MTPWAVPGALRPDRSRNRVEDAAALPAVREPAPLMVPAKVVGALTLKPLAPVRLTAPERMMGCDPPKEKLAEPDITMGLPRLTPPATVVCKDELTGAPLVVKGPPRT